jgi:hypothetical protein
MLNYIRDAFHRCDIMGENQAAVDELGAVDALSQRGTATLVHTPSHRHVQPCLEYERVAPPDAVACLTVALTDSFDAVIDRWEQHPGERPAELAVVTTGDPVRSATADASGGYVDLPAGVKTTSVSETGDLTGIAIRIHQALDSWTEDGPEHVVVCFDSLTTLAQYTDIERVFRFLHVLITRLRDAGVESHFHVDPGAHDDRELAILRNLFGAVRSDPSTADE